MAVVGEELWCNQLFNDVRYNVDKIRGIDSSGGSDRIKFEPTPFHSGLAYNLYLYEIKSEEVQVNLDAQIRCIILIQGIQNRLPPHMTLP